MYKRQAKFSFSPETQPVKEQLPCFLVYTSKEVHDILRTGSERARAAAAETLAEVRRAMRIDYFEDKELIEEQARHYARQAE